MSKHIFIYFLVLISTQPFFAQICGGNLGENIFTEGDFGSGSANTLNNDPQIAPGYIYLATPPPEDGYYTITNNIASWNYAFDWITISDNSSDSNGYMMVVNAGFSPGIFYQQVVDDLCENTTYEFSADIHNLAFANQNRIHPNVSFYLDGQSQYSTGEIPQNEQWNTYGFTFTTESGQTSVTLSLRNNAPGGIGNDLALDNIRFRACGPEALILPTEIANICEDGSPVELQATVVGDEYDTPFFQWQQSFDEGHSWTNIVDATASTYIHTDLSAGYYYYRYLLANGASNLQSNKCRVNSNTKIVYVVPKFYTISDTLCEGNTFLFGENEYKETGTYVDSLLTTIGCDSIVTLILTFVEDPDIHIQADIQQPTCYNASDGNITLTQVTNGVVPYTFIVNGQENFNNGAIYNIPEGTYTYAIIDYYGCQLDSLLLVENPDPFIIDLGANKEVTLGESVNISSAATHPVDQYLWMPQELVPCTPDCDSYEWLPLESTHLSVTAISNFGCVGSDSIFIRVRKIRDVYAPNVFSPNDDGVNDKFNLIIAPSIVSEIEQLSIYDRWGGNIFEAQGIPAQESTGWDGKANGTPMPPGVYTYMAKVRFIDGHSKQYAGDILLLR